MKPASVGDTTNVEPASSVANARTRADGRVVLEDGCVDGHRPDLVSCPVGVDWP